MPKPRTAPTLVNTMSKETFKLLTEKEKRKFALVPFKDAFAEVAHKHDIWLYKEKEEPEKEGQYSHFFQQVMRRVKRLIREYNQPTEPKKIPVVIEPPEKIVIPTILPKRSEYDLTLELF